MRFFVAALLAPAAIAFAQAPATSPVAMKIGYVNTERILREATPAVRAQRKIEAEFQKRDQELARFADVCQLTPSGRGCARPRRRTSTSQALRP